MTRSIICSSFLAILVMGASGCSKPPRTEEPDTSNFRRIYQAFLASEDQRNRPPKDLAELKELLGQTRERGTPDEFMTSRRDKQPIVVNFGGGTEAGSAAILAHEALGVEGKRYVLTRGGNITQLSDAEFATVKPAK